MKPALTLVIGLIVGCTLGQETSAQTSGELDIRLYAGLTITGTVGTAYSIEYTADPVQTNAWNRLAVFQLPASPYVWIDTSAPATEQRFYRFVLVEPSPAPTNMVYIPSGTFMMGSPPDEVGRSFGEDLHAVTISRSFWMGKCEVTQGEYLAVTGSNPSRFQPPNATADTNRPVEQVSWGDATNYCGQLTRRERLAGRIGINSVYRLPTEAEWEYACRAWTSTRFSYGDDPGYTSLATFAWYGNATHPVGQKLPNPWGLYDMHGNVGELCQDWYSTRYPSGAVSDPQGPATGSYRVVRGGNWVSGGAACRSASRSLEASGVGSLIVGFRVVLAPVQP